MKKFLLILFIILIVLGSNSCSQSSNNYDSVLKNSTSSELQTYFIKNFNEDWIWSIDNSASSIDYDYPNGVVLKHPKNKNLSNFDNFKYVINFLDINDQFKTYTVDNKTNCIIYRNIRPSNDSDDAFRSYSIFIDKSDIYIRTLIGYIPPKTSNSLNVISNGFIDYEYLYQLDTSPST